MAIRRPTDSAGLARRLKSVFGPEIIADTIEAREHRAREGILDAPPAGAWVLFSNRKEAIFEIDLTRHQGYELNRELRSALRHLSFPEGKTVDRDSLPLPDEVFPECYQIRLMVDPLLKLAQAKAKISFSVEGAVAKAVAREQMWRNFQTTKTNEANHLFLGHPITGTDRRDPGSVQLVLHEDRHSTLFFQLRSSEYGKREAQDKLNQTASAAGVLPYVRCHNVSVGTHAPIDKFNLHLLPSDSIAEMWMKMAEVTTTPSAYQRRKKIKTVILDYARGRDAYNFLCRDLPNPSIQRYLEQQVPSSRPQTPNWHQARQQATARLYANNTAYAAFDATVRDLSTGVTVDAFLDKLRNPPLGQADLYRKFRTAVGLRLPLLRSELR